ncbi:MAG: hypothetical protein Q9163_003766 [Psora crenata]
MLGVVYPTSSQFTDSQEWNLYQSACQVSEKDEENADPWRKLVPTVANKDRITLKSLRCMWHYNSKSPDGKFGFHVPTFHGNLPTYTGWEESWTVMYTKILTRAMDIDQSKSDPGPEFIAVRRLLFDKVIPRLLGLLSSQGRTIKPCLGNGDLWDENCAIDMATGEPFAFDAGSLYAHKRTSIKQQSLHSILQAIFPVSEPGSSPTVLHTHKKPTDSIAAEEWDDRNLLYYRRYNIGCNVLTPSSGQREVELSEIVRVLNTSTPGDITEGEELEYKYEEVAARLHRTAKEMGIGKDDLLNDHNGGDQAVPISDPLQDRSDLASQAEPQRREGFEATHSSDALETESQNKRLE